jgi:hypothetical protein
MSEHQKNRRAHNEAADEAKLEDEALNEVQGGIFGPGSCDPGLDKLNKPLTPKKEKSENAWDFSSKRDGETPSR